MNLNNLLAGIIALLALTCSNVLLADDSSEDMPVMETVNINEADADTLARILVGVGQSRAEAIVQFREENGNFFAAEELAAVRGIGESTVAKNAERIVLD